MKKGIYFWGSILTGTVVFLGFNILRTKEKLYYVPQNDMYIKIINPPLDKYGYIVLAQDSVILLSDEIDYIKVCKSETSSIDIICNPNDKKQVYINDRANSSTINSVKYEIRKISFKDPLLFTEEKIAGISTYLLKPPYFDINFDGYFEEVYISINSYESPEKLNTIR